MTLKGIGWNSMVQTRFHLAKYRENWQALVKMVVNVWVPQIAGNFLTI